MVKAQEYDAHKTSVFDCTLLELDKHTSELGNLSVMENRHSIPFDIQRAYYLYDIPGGQSRGAHAHKKLQQFIVSVGGSFDITLDDGLNRRTFTLSRPYYGLLIPPGIWRDLVNFSAGATCLVLASEHYDTEDYIRNYDDYVNFKNSLI
nr:FdtA/QdtA family cupin domain-containing protein [Bacteroides clarus]